MLDVVYQLELRRETKTIKGLKVNPGQGPVVEPGPRRGPSEKARQETMHSEQAQNRGFESHRARQIGRLGPSPRLEEITDRLSKIPVTGYRLPRGFIPKIQ